MKKSELKKIIKEVINEEDIPLELIKKAILEFNKNEKLRLPFGIEEKLSIYIKEKLNEEGYQIIDGRRGSTPINLA